MNHQIAKRKQEKNKTTEPNRENDDKHPHETRVENRTRHKRSNENRQALHHYEQRLGRGCSRVVFHVPRAQLAEERRYLFEERSKQKHTHQYKRTADSKKAEEVAKTAPPKANCHKRIAGTVTSSLSNKIKPPHPTHSQPHKIITSKKKKKIVLCQAEEQKF
jgi:hypothetical protein